MTTKVKSINIETYAKTKKYCYQTETRYNTYGSDEYMHPVISFFELWQYNGHYSKGFRKFYFEFQSHKDNGAWKPAYGGSIEGAKFDNIEDIAKIIKAAENKTKELSIYSGDAYKSMLIALRAAGYKEGHDDGDYITWLD